MMQILRGLGRGWNLLEEPLSNNLWLQRRPQGANAAEHLAVEPTFWRVQDEDESRCSPQRKALLLQDGVIL